MGTRIVEGHEFRAPCRSGRGPTWVKSPAWRQANKDPWERMQGR